MGCEVMPRPCLLIASTIDFLASVCVFIADLQSSLTIANSCSSPFTLEVMSYVSILIPFVLGYIFYAWRALDLRKISGKEMEEKDTHTY